MQNKSGGLLSAIGDSFFAFQSKLQFFEREYLKKKGIDEVTPAEIKVLYMIGMSNTKSMSEIADELKITRGTLSITVDNLVKKGYVIRARNKQDRRVVILYLTKKSVSIVKDYEEFYNALVRNLVGSIDADKVVALEEILRNLNKIIETNFYGEENK